jgi:hypothetical protein
MGYIIKNTSALINTRLTDVGRRFMSQGNFNISYFSLGDSEVNYTAVPNYSQPRNNILMPAFNAQNDTGTPESNKQNIKYPFYVEGITGNTYGIPFDDAQVQPIYNSQSPFGFFTSGGTYPFGVQTSSAYTVTSNYYLEMNTLSGQSSPVTILFDSSSPIATTGTPQIGDLITIYMDKIGTNNYFLTSPVLTYQIQSLDPTSGPTGQTYWNLTLDRPVPNFSGLSIGNLGRVYVYPSGMTQLYDSVTPAPYWQDDTINFESPCDISNRENTLIWNMNIPWSESPAGLFNNTYEDYTKFGSVTYIGTKEYLGYQEPSGQTDTSEVFYYNSFDEKIVVQPQDQKCIGIVHYTNQSIDNVYGEKFATLPYDPQNPTNQTGLARNFKVTLPTLMWHKSTGNTMGETFYIDPPGYDLCTPFYIKSKVNPDMNDPGIRYYHLWDLNPDSNNNLNRVGKVFPDQEIVVFDDEEICASMSYKANRNWTLPAPQLSLLTPNSCTPTNTVQTGLLNNPDEKLWVTYIFENTGFTESLHCNYYSMISGPQVVQGSVPQNVAIRFGEEFPFLVSGGTSGFTATGLKILCQFVSGDTRPQPTQWREIDFTSQLSTTLVGGGFIVSSGLTSQVFEISLNNYTGATTYNLANYISLPTLAQPNVLNFGDEYYFYGNLETDIMATIYEMKYLINLGNNQFTSTSNPTFVQGTQPFITEIGLYNSNKDLMVISKLQSPVKRQGIQQFVVKLDF